MAGSSCEELYSTAVNLVILEIPDLTHDVPQIIFKIIVKVCKGKLDYILF